MVNVPYNVPYNFHKTHLNFIDMLDIVDIKTQILISNHKINLFHQKIYMDFEEAAFEIYSENISNPHFLDKAKPFIHVANTESIILFSLTSGGIFLLLSVIHYCIFYKFPDFCLSKYVSKYCGVSCLYGRAQKRANQDDSQIAIATSQVQK